MPQTADYTSPAGSRLRLFVALHCPLSAPLALACSLVQQAGSRAGLRPVASHTQHVTLRFLGSMPAARVPALSACIDTVAQSHASLTLAFAGAGRFQDALWLGLAPAPALEHLVLDLSTALEDLGIAADPRRFVPHLTLARLQRGAVDDLALQELLMRLSGLSPGRLEVDHMHLYRSETQSEGARYTVLHSSALGMAGHG